LKSIFWKRVLLIALALTTLLVVVGCKDSAKYAVMAERIYYDYTTDAAAADEMYKNTKVQVTGIIRSLGTASTGQPYVILAVGDLSETCGVQCSFTSKYASMVASLSVGQQITISGECLGYSNHVVIVVD
jgi:cytochrome c-type biogenesis protein CcmE